MSGPSFNPADYPQGPFSPLQSLVRDALREMGESSPDVFIAMQQKRMLNYGNKVVNEVNKHPMFMDLLHNAWDPVSGCSITAGTNLLNVPTSAGLSLGAYSPIKIVGAGSGGGDMITFALSGQNGVYKLADEADTSVTSATVKPLYSTRIKPYTSITEVRAIDDHVMIEGIKYFYTGDDASGPFPVQIKTNAFYTRLNAWMVTLINGFGDLTMTLRDEDDF